MFFFLLLVSTLLFSCSSGANQPESTSTPSPTSPQVAFSYPITQFAQEAQATAEAHATIARQQTQTQATQAAAQSKTQESTSAEELAQATAQAHSMFLWIEQLYAAGTLTTTTGTYYQLPDFEASWAQINYYDFLLTEDVVRDFVIRSTAEWESASKVANFWNSGCGYVFRMNARGDHYLFLLGMDGLVYLYRSINQNLLRLGSARYANTASPAGSATIMLAVQGERITLFVEDTQIAQIKDRTLSFGALGYALASGTNKDFGTHCTMTDVELWKLGE